MAVNAQADAQLRSVQLAPPAHFEACHCRYPARIGKEKGSTLYKPEISAGHCHPFQRAPVAIPARTDMPDQPTFDEALRRQREVFADRYKANQELSQYVDELFGNNEEQKDD
jgi:hypothetical protein